jgi:ABC-type branched-subunit amino acid transport system substrate-binding protein
MQARKVLIAVMAIALALVANATIAGAQSTTTAKGSKPSGEPIKVAVLMSQTGALASSGKPQLEGINIWNDTVGKTEGILGRPVELVVKDDASSAATAGAAARELLAEQPDFIVGPLASAVGGAVLPLFNDAKILNLNMGSLTASSDPTTYPFTFNMNALKTTEAQAQYDYLCKLGVSKVAIISPTGPVGDAQVAAANGKLGSSPCAKKLKLVATERHDPGAPDLTTQVQKVQQSGAEAVLAGEYIPTDFNSLYRAMKDINYTPWVFSNLISGYTESVGTADPTLVNKILPFGCGVNNVVPLSKATKAYDANVKKSGMDITNYSMPQGGYAAMETLKSAAEGANSTDASAVAAWLESNPVPALLWTYKFSPTLHNGVTADQIIPCKAGSSNDQGYWEKAGTAKALKKKYGS